MKTLSNSNLFPIISVGMYDSLISAENLFDDYYINEDKENGYIAYNSEWFWDNFDNELYKKHIEKLAHDFLNGVLCKDGISITIKCGAIYSPKYYNFATDNIDFEIKYNKAIIRKFAQKNKEQFDLFLKENYSSYDGFCSFTANNFKDWLIDFEENKDQAIGAILTYIFQDECKDKYDEFIHYVYANTSYTEFVDSSQINTLKLEL